jgi:hypothetical protein
MARLFDLHAHKPSVALRWSGRLTAPLLQDGTLLSRPCNSALQATPPQHLQPHHMFNLGCLLFSVVMGHICLALSLRGNLCNDEKGRWSAPRVLPPSLLFVVRHCRIPGLIDIKSIRDARCEQGRILSSTANFIYCLQMREFAVLDPSWLDHDSTSHI